MSEKTAASQSLQFQENRIERGLSLSIPERELNLPRSAKASAEKMTARVANAFRDASSISLVILANGPRILNGPSIKKKNIKTSLRSKPDAAIPEVDKSLVIDSKS